MRIRLKKKSEKEAVLAVTRADGSFTGAQLRSDGFGAIHDLTHYVVEQTLGTDKGFFGLLGYGWNIRDFENKTKTALIPDEAIVIECIVGQLTNVVMRGPAVGADDFNWLVSQAVTGMQLKLGAPPLSEAIFSRLVETLTDVLRQWKALPIDGTLELDFFPTGVKVAC